MFHWAYAQLVPSDFVTARLVSPEAAFMFMALSELMACIPTLSKARLLQSRSMADGSVDFIYALPEELMSFGET